MNGHASIHRYGEGVRGALQERVFRHRFLLVCAVVAFTVCSSLPGEALNGEPVGAEGLHRTAACTEDVDPDFTISCDDRPEAGVVSCHMRRPKVGDALANDEGLAINACIDGRVTAGSVTLGTTQGFLEKKVTIEATDFGEFVCGQELVESEFGSELVDFCLVCDTFVEGGAGASHCVKIVSNQDLEEPPTCGAFNISGDPGGLCQSAELDLQQFFSDPHLGFTIGFGRTDSGQPGAKDLVVCGGRSWECKADRSLPLATDAQQVQEQQTHAFINTPCCMRLASGSYYCSAKLTPSSTCR